MHSRRRPGGIRLVLAARRALRRALVPFAPALARRRLAPPSGAGEERLKAAAESLPDGLAIFDADDRFVFYNQRYPSHLTPALREGLRLGVRFEDWLRAACSRESVYHADMGEAFFERRLALHRQESAEHEQKLADGRWLRLRERRTPDGGRVLLTTDITAQKTQSEALADQTRKLEAVLANIAEGVGITDEAGQVLLVNEGLLRLYGFPAEFATPGTPLAAFVEHRIRAGFVTPKEAGVPLPELVARRVARFVGDERATYEEPVPGGRTVMVRRQRLPDGLIVSTHSDVTELKRRERENALFAAAIEQAGDSIEVADTGYRLTYVNPAFTRLTGWTSGEALGRKPAELLRSDRHDAAFFAEIDATLMRGEVWKGRLVSRHKDGRLIFQEATLSPLRDGKGRLTHLLAFKRDIGERIRAEEALRESEARYRAVVEGQTEFILRLRPDGILTFANDAYCRYRGQPREVLLAGDFDDIAHYPEAQRARVRAAWSGLSPDRPRATYELKEPRADGGVRYEEWTDTGIFDVEGRLVEVQAVGRDITERRRAELALKESEELLRSIVDDQTDFVSRYDADFKLVFSNAANARAVFDRPPEEVLGTDLFEHLPEWLRERLRAELAALTPERPVHRGSNEKVLPDGKVRWFDWINRAIFDDEGRVVGYQSVGRDVTEQHRAETLLRESEARLAAFMEHAPVGMYLKGPDGRYLMLNPEMARVFGRPTGEMLGKDSSAAFPPDAVDTIRRHDAEVLAEGRPSRREEFLAERDEYAWSMVIRFAVRSGDGRNAQIGGFVVDVTSQKRAVAELAASEARFRAMVEDQTEFISRFTPDFAITFVNPAYAQQLGREREELVGTSLLDLMTGEQRARFTAQLAALTPESPTVTYEMYAELPDGRRGWEQWTDRALFDAEERVVEYQSVGRDVTARKGAEDELRASEQRLRAIAESHPIPMTITRLSDRRLLFANRAFHATFRLSPEKLATFDRSRLYVRPEDREILFDMLVAKGVVEGYETEMRAADGDAFPVSLSARAIEYEGAPCSVSSYLDLSALKAAEAEIARQRDALHQSEKLTALGSLLAGVAHELNNPLSVVTGYAEMLREAAPDPATRTRAERVHAAAERCARIVKTFLAMARQRPPQRGPVDLAGVIGSALELAAYGLRTAGVSVTVETEPGLPHVWGDADQLHQVFVNLAVNAQHALTQVNAPRQLAIRARAEGGEVLVEVEDNGPGMAPEVRKRIFEPFFTTKAQGVGTGIGLSVCHGIVAAHGGRVEVESEPGRGAVFRITLPAAAGPGAPLAEAAPEAPGVRGRVLVVDDEREIADLVAETLRRDGLEVEVAAGGRAALARLSRGGIDLVVSDLRMPDIDGPALIEAVRGLRPGRSCVERPRLILITGDALGARTNEVVREAGVPTLEKPLDLGALRREVRRLLEDGGRARDG